MAVTVVDDETIFGQIREAIMMAEQTGNAIKHIEITADDMENLLKVDIATQSADKHYASFLNEWAVHSLSPLENISGKKLPRTAWVRYVKIITVPNP